MALLASSIRYYVVNRLNNDAGWKNASISLLINYRNTN
jgi:5'-3' exonuclease